MTKHIELKRFNQGTALTGDTLALPPLVIEGLAEFNGSFDRLCLKAGTAAVAAMLAARGPAGLSMGPDRQRGRLARWQGGNPTATRA